jgi:nucleoside-diphosphate-sugar epimerase
LSSAAKEAENGMRVLIYGANGYLGGRLVKRMVEAEHTVSGFVRSKTAADNLRQMGAQPVLGDLDDPVTTLAPLADNDAIIFAAQLMLEAEHKTIKAVLQAIRGTGKTFILTSGTAVLSQRTDGDWSEDTFTEFDEFVPSKYIGFRQTTENLVREAAGDGIRAMVVRPPLIWGNGGCLTVKQLYLSAAKTGAVCYIGRGLNLYSSVHVDDLAELYRLALDKGVAGALYHCVSGETNFRAMAEGVARVLNLPTRSITMPEAMQIWDKFTAIIALGVCSRSRCPRARKDLGWAPSPDRLDILDEIRHPAMLAAKAELMT